VCHPPGVGSGVPRASLTFSAERERESWSVLLIPDAVSFAKVCTDAFCSDEPQTWKHLLMQSSWVHVISTLPVEIKYCKKYSDTSPYQVLLFLLQSFLRELRKTLALVLLCCYCELHWRAKTQKWRDAYQRCRVDIGVASQQEPHHVEFTEMTGGVQRCVPSLTQRSQHILWIRDSTINHWHIILGAEVVLPEKVKGRPIRRFVQRPIIRTPEALRYKSHSFYLQIYHTCFYILS